MIAVARVSAFSPEPSKTCAADDPLAGLGRLDQVCHVLGREDGASRKLDHVAFGHGCSAPPPCRPAPLQLASPRNSSCIRWAVERADVEAELRVVAGLPAREAHVVGEARALVGLGDEAQALQAQPTVAGRAPLQDEAAAHHRQPGAGLRLGEAQAVGGPVRQEIDGRRVRRRRAGAERKPGRQGGPGDKAQAERVGSHGRFTPMHRLGVRAGLIDRSARLQLREAGAWRGRNCSSHASCRTRSRRGFGATTILLNEDDRAHGPDDLVRLAQGADGVLTCSTERWDAAALERLPERVRVIASYSVGYEHLDLAACRRRGIVATNTPDVLTEATADIALLVPWARRAGLGRRSMLRSRRWERWRSTEQLGARAHRAGAGDRRHGAYRAGDGTAGSRLRMAIHYHNRRRSPEDKAQGAVYHETLESLLPRCHFLSLHCPGGAETHHLVNDRTIGLLPHGAVVVNTARGTLVDDEALIAALRSGRLFAAGLDVYANEPNIHPGYHDPPNCFLLPHLGSATVETRDAWASGRWTTLDAFFAGRQAPDALTWRGGQGRAQPTWVRIIEPLEAGLEPAAFGLQA